MKHHKVQLRSKLKSLHAYKEKLFLLLRTRSSVITKANAVAYETSVYATAFGSECIHQRNSETRINFVLRHMLTPDLKCIYLEFSCSLDLLRLLSGSLE